METRRKKKHIHEAAASSSKLSSDVECPRHKKFQLEQLDSLNLKHTKMENKCIDVQKSVKSKSEQKKAIHGMTVKNDDLKANFSPKFVSDSESTKLKSCTDVKLILEPRVMLEKLDLKQKVDELNENIIKTKVRQNSCIVKNKSLKRSYSESQLNSNSEENPLPFPVTEEDSIKYTDENCPIIQKKCISELNSEVSLDIPLNVINELNEGTGILITNTRSLGKESDMIKDNISESVLDSNMGEASYAFSDNEVLSDEISESECFHVKDDIFTRTELYSNPFLSIPTNVIQKFIHYPIESSESLNVYQMLSKHCTNKLTQVLQSAVKYKERWGRETLTAEDFKKGLIFCGFETLSDVPDITLPDRRKTRKRKPRIINLVDGFKAHKPTASKSKMSINEQWLSKNDPLSKDLSVLPSGLITYFNLMTSSILDLDRESCSMALEDLKVNKNVLNLVPHFVRFVDTEMRTQISDLPRLSLLKVVHSLLFNPCLTFGRNSHFNALAYLLLTCLFDPFPHLNLSWDKWLLKETAAQLLSQVLKRSMSRKLEFEVMFILETVLCDKEKSFLSHYGVLVALNSIGVPAIIMTLLPHIDDYFSYIKSADPSDYQTKCNIYAVQSQLIISYYLWISNFLKVKTNESLGSCHRSQHLASGLETKESKIILRASFSEYFGDSLVPYFPLLDFVSFSRNYKRNKFQSSLKKKVHHKVRHWVSNKVSTNNNKPVSNSVFDHQPIKKLGIKFGKLKKY